MNIKVLITAICLIPFCVPTIIQAGELQPFTTDGCSSFPNGTHEQDILWLKCCTAHDYEYWKGGTYEERLESDKALEKCVTQVGKPNIALLMLAGVRIGGAPFFPTAFRWGYGWPYPKFYGALTKEELAQVKNLTRKIKTDPR